MFIIDAVSAETRGQTALPSSGDSTCVHSLLRPGPCSRRRVVGAAARTKVEIMFL